MADNTHDWYEIVKARNGLEAANECHLGLTDQYTSVSTPIIGGQPISVSTRAAKNEIEEAKEWLNAARERMRRAQDRAR